MEPTDPEIETRTIALQIALPILPLSLIVGLGGYALAGSTELQQNLPALAWFAVWSVLIVALAISAFFSDMRVDSYGISFRTPLPRLLGFKGYPVTFFWDEIDFQSRYNGRLFVVNKGKAWERILFYSFWLMPHKWRESLAIVEKYRQQTISVVKEKES